MRTIKIILKDFLKFYSQFNEDYKNINLDDPIQSSIVYHKLLEKVYEPKYGCFWFKKFIIGDMKETGSGGIRWNNLINKWHKITNKHEDKYLVFLCARSHGKTTFFSIIRTIYKAFLHKNYQQVIISASSIQASLIVRDIRTVIENNEMLKKLVNFNKWSTEFLSFNSGFIISRGIGAEIRGLHPHRVVLDDILRSDEKLSRIKIESYVLEDIIPAIAPKNGSLELVGTKKDFTDIFHYIDELIKDGATKWKSFKFPGILNMEKKIVLAKDIHTFNDLMEMKKTMGTLQFNKEILCESIAEGSRIFSEELLQMSKEKTFSYEYVPEKNTAYYGGVDLARSGSVSADSTAALFLKFEKQFQFFIVVDLYHKKGIKINKQVKDISLICEKFNDAILLAEQNNFGQDFIDEMGEKYNTAIESIRTTPQTKEDCIRRLLIAFEQEKIKFPYMTVEDRRKTELIFDELRHYIIKATPAGNEKMEASGNSHDDIVDALMFALKCAQTSGFDPSKLPTERGSELEHIMDLNMIPEKEGDMSSFDMPPILFN